MSEWVPAGVGPVLLVNERTQQVIARKVELALSRRTRRVGLLGRTRIDAAAALVLAPCWTIHTAFMRFPIDLLFVDRYGRSLRVVHALKPWRAAMSAGAYAAIELAAGMAKQHGIGSGDRLRLVSTQAQPPREAV